VSARTCKVGCGDDHEYQHVLRDRVIRFGRKNLDRHPNYILAAYMASGA
jgi:hypothetical protein